MSLFPIYKIKITVEVWFRYAIREHEYRKIFVMRHFFEFFRIFLPFVFIQQIIKSCMGTGRQLINIKSKLIERVSSSLGRGGRNTRTYKLLAARGCRRFPLHAFFSHSQKNAAKMPNGVGQRKAQNWISCFPFFFFKHPLSIRIYRNTYKTKIYVLLFGPHYSS